MQRSSTQTPRKSIKEKENNVEILIRHMTKYKIIKTNLRCFCITIFLLAIYFLVISVLLTVFARGDYLYSVRFDDKCEDLKECTFLWNLEQDLEGPVYLLFGFNNFFVNHRSIALSTFEPQMIGKEVGSDYQLKEFCGEKAMINEDLIKLGHAEIDPSDDTMVLVKEVSHYQ